MATLLRDMMVKEEIVLETCTKCGLNYHRGAAHNCFSMIMQILVKTQRALLKRTRQLEALQKKHDSLSS
jgi:hypothetical protein